MTLADVRRKLEEHGIAIVEYTLRRRIDEYITCPTRGKMNNYRDITEEEFRRLLLALCLEVRDVPSEDIKDYLDGKMDKAKLVDNLVNSCKVDEVLKQWIKE